MLTLAFVSTVALLMLSLLLALQGGHVLRRAVRSGRSDPRRDRAVGVAVTICSLAAGFVWTTDAMEHGAILPTFRAIALTLAVVAWAAAFIVGMRRGLPEAAEARLYVGAASLAVVAFVSKDNVFTWADGVCVFGLIVWLLSTYAAGRNRRNGSGHRQSESTEFVR